MAAPRASRVIWALQMILCAVGISLSIYAYHVETTKETDHDFQAMCDISETMSCSKVFTSKYGRGFGLVELIFGKNNILNQPNSVFGVIFYILQIVLGNTASILAATVQIGTAILANFGSVYLAYILYFILEDFCVVCVSTYVVNFLLLLVCFVRRNQLTGLVAKKRA